MDLSSFACEVYLKLPPYPADEDVYVDMGIKDCFEKGFSVIDTVRYMSLMEHIQAYNAPHLSEEHCLKHMNAISIKYKRAGT